MEIQLINDELLEAMQKLVSENERKRMNFDLRTTPENGSQRMLNVLEVGTKIDVHRHFDTTETIVCIKSKVDEMFYAELPNMDAGGPGREFKETSRVTLCPAEGTYGIQVTGFRSLQVYGTLLRL